MYLPKYSISVCSDIGMGFFLTFPYLWFTLFFSAGH